MRDIVIRGGTILDGTGSAAFAADFFGFGDRGRLKPGLRADVNLIDFESLRLHQPEALHDLPAGGRRLRVDGYRATLVAGTPVFENGAETGARPGRLVRAGR